jgi:hypothetical protein
MLVAASPVAERLHGGVGSAAPMAMPTVVGHRWSVVHAITDHADLLMLSQATRRCVLLTLAKCEPEPFQRDAYVITETMG